MWSQHFVPVMKHAAPYAVVVVALVTAATATAVVAVAVVAVVVTYADDECRNRCKSIVVDKCNCSRKMTVTSTNECQSVYNNATTVLLQYQTVNTEQNLNQKFVNMLELICFWTWKAGTKKPL